MTGLCSDLQELGGDVFRCKKDRRGVEYVAEVIYGSYHFVDCQKDGFLQGLKPDVGVFNINFERRSKDCQAVSLIEFMVTLLSIGPVARTPWLGNLRAS